MLCLPPVLVILLIFEGQRNHIAKAITGTSSLFRPRRMLQGSSECCIENGDMRTEAATSDKAEGRRSTEGASFISPGRSPGCRRQVNRWKPQRGATRWSARRRFVSPFQGCGSLRVRGPRAAPWAFESRRFVAKNLNDQRKLLFGYFLRAIRVAIVTHCH